MELVATRRPFAYVPLRKHSEQVSRCRNGRSIALTIVLRPRMAGPKNNRHYWRKDYRGFLEFFYSKVYPEPHSTKQIDDGVAWGLETTPDVLIATVEAPSVLGRLAERPEEAMALYRSIRCPVLVIHGDQDAIVSYTRGVAIAEATGTPLVTIVGGGHHNFGRDPVKTNLVLKAFIDRVSPPDERCRPR